MPKQSPEELDKLFQQGAEQYDFEYNEDAWADMESLLDKDDRRRGLWWWIGGVAVTILLVILFFTVHKNNSTNYTHNQKSYQQKKENIDLLNKTVNANKKPNNTPKVLKPLPSDTTQTIQITTKKERKISPNQPSLQPKPKTAFEKIKSIKQVKGKVTSKPIAQISSPRTTSDQIEKSSLNSRETQPPVKIDSVVAVGIEITKIPTLLSTIHIDKKELLAYDANINNTKTPGLANKPPHNDMILISAGIGGELSSVGIDHFSKESWKIGGQISYRYNSKYSTGIGAYYSRKKYEAGEGEYIPPQGFWTRMIAPQATSAQCNILELPISIGFFPKGYTKNGFYADLAITSYVMLKERYYYSYDLPDSDLIRTWGTKNENQTWFGMGQASFGYQYLTGKKTSIQLGSYIEFPLDGIGHGQVKLWSVGLHCKFNFQVY